MAGAGIDGSDQAQCSDHSGLVMEFGAVLLGNFNASVMGLDGGDSRLVGNRWLALWTGHCEQSGNDRANYGSRASQIPTHYRRIGG